MTLDIDEIEGEVFWKEIIEHVGITGVYMMTSLATS